jgi:beta-aspartyl-peptidase (threonine type)
MRKFVFVIVMFVVAVSAASQTQSTSAEDEAAIRAVLNAQVAAWNKGDLDEYMKGYWNSPDLIFISGGTENRGYEAALDRYKKSYKSAGREMGKLDFSELRTTILGPDSAYATGKFHLKMSNGKEPTGRFTLIWRKFPDGWKIIHDHSCGD